MEQWLESLSEDWVSQKGSHDSSALSERSHGAHGMTSSSRLPRAAFSSSKRPSAKEKASGQGRPNGLRGSQRDALRARTPSQINESNSIQTSGGAQRKSQQPQDAFTSNLKQDGNSGNFIQDTTRHHNSPAKLGEGDTTPEWRRRLIDKKLKAGEKVDLLQQQTTSLEGVFRPPTIKQHAANGHIKRKLGNVSGQGHNVASKPEAQETDNDRIKWKSQTEGPFNRGREPERDDFADETTQGPVDDAFDMSQLMLTSPMHATDNQLYDDDADQSAIDMPLQRIRSMMNDLRIESPVKGQPNVGSDPNARREEDIFQFDDQDSFDDDAFDHGSMMPQTSELRDVDGQSPHVSDSNTRQDNSDVEGSEISPPATPIQERGEPEESPRRPRSAGSPFKIFNRHDTFTNDKLARRISKFEETFGQEQDWSSLNEGSPPNSPSPGPKKGPEMPDQDHNRRTSSFGEGDLNDHAFALSAENLPILEDSGGFHGRETSSLNRKSSSRRSSNNYRKPQKVKQRRVSSGIGGPRHVIEKLSTRKRPSISAMRSPAPKRVRGIQPANVDESDGKNAHSNMLKSLTGKKRKDALYHNEERRADPEILAMRQIRRPRNPTPNHAASLNKSVREGQRLTDALPSIDEYGQKGSIDPPTRIVADALASVAVNAAHDAASESRKASLTTADFFNEAQQIMKLIREERRPRSSRAGDNNSEDGTHLLPERSVFEDTTLDEFSRPPSRSEDAAPKTAAPKQLDPRVISHLRKFEDNEEIGIALSSSLKTAASNQSRTGSEGSVVRKEPTAALEVFESDPPNIRIRERQPSHARDFPSVSSRQDSQRETSQKSQPSSGRSIPTTSSGGSANRLLLAPESVAHVLSDQMAGMTFDRHRQKWVKSQKLPQGDDTSERAQGNESTESALDGIPDLSVDEMEELKMVKGAFVSAGKADHQQEEFDNEGVVDEAHDFVPQDSRPRTAEDRSIAVPEDSSARSKYSQFASSGLMPSTRATSWGDEYWSIKPPPMQAPNLPAVDEVQAAEREEEEAEHEISIFEGRAADPPNETADKRRKARAVTVAFSSPLIERTNTISEDFSLLDDQKIPEDLWHEAEPSFKDAKPRRYPKARGPSSASFGMFSANRSLLGRPMSRLDEEEELSMIRFSVQNNQALDIAITTPLPSNRSRLIASTPGASLSSALRLSPLAEFSLHQVDKPLDTSSGAVIDYKPLRGRHQLSLTGQQLVSHLTDIEPYEPYWEHMDQIDLRNRGLTSLYMLNEFCGRVQQLNLSHNRIGELNGIPSTVRFLDLQQNAISDLTAWQHLQHLQYLDISGNGLTTLKGLKNLVHLRALKADNNNIETLEGFDEHNGLLGLSVANNQLKRIDFKAQHLARLIELDLRGNSIHNIHNIELLPSLKKINLGFNCIKTFNVSNDVARLEVLDLQSNGLEYLELSSMPALRQVNVDCNPLKHIHGLQNLRCLESLSRREGTYDIHIDDSYRDCHHLYLSGGPLTDFLPTQTLLNLRTVELASCGMRRLPPDFGVKCPNIRRANFNFNALKDLRPLIGISRLERLCVVGNRLSRLRQTMKTLEAVGSHLIEIDLRNNPLNTGFYTPTSGLQGTVRSKRGVMRRTEAAAATMEYWMLQDQDKDKSLHAADRDEENWGTMGYTMDPLDGEADVLTRARLDEDTKLRRQVYETLIAFACPALHWLDGLSSEFRDRDAGSVGKRLLELGVVRDRS